MSSLSYRPEIDGLRALSIAGVLLFHLSPGLLPGGFIGVDVFFVISGYLITSITLSDLDRGTFTLAAFWNRRIRRILPALLFMLASVLAAGWILLFPPHFKSLCEQAFGALALHGNHVVLELSRGYWGQSAESLPLLHTWSLGVEEQFYVIFPLAVLWLWPRVSPRTILLLVATLALGSLMACILLTHSRPSETFFLLPTRAWEILLGCGLALFMRGRPPLANGVLSGAALAILVAAMFIIPSGESFPGWQALVPVLCAMILIACHAPGSFGAALLECKGATYLGKISYSLYLWHWPALVFSRLIWHDEPVLGGVVAGLVTIAGATISYHLIESPARSMVRPWRLAAGILVPMAAATLLFPNLRGEIKVDGSLVAVWRGRDYDAIDDGGLPAWKSNGVDQRTSPAPSERPPGVARVLRAGGDGPAALVVGDSHAMALGSAMERALHANGCSAVFMTADGSRPGAAKSLVPMAQFAGKSLGELQLEAVAARKFDLLLVAFRYDQLDTARMRASLHFVGRLAEAGNIKKIIMVGQPPVLPFGDVSAPEYFTWHQDRHPDAPPPLHVISRQRAAAEDLVSGWPFSSPPPSFLPVAHLLLDGSGRILLHRRAGLYFIDDDHLSEQGAALLEDHLADAISRKLAE